MSFFKKISIYLGVIDQLHTQENRTKRGNQKKKSGKSSMCESKKHMKNFVFKENFIWFLYDAAKLKGKRSTCNSNSK